MAETTPSRVTTESQLTEKVSEGSRIAVVENVAFADAVAKSNVRPWTRRMFHLYFFMFIATLNSCINGYDGSLMGAINAMKPYQRQFGMETTGSSTGWVFAIYTVGNICGSFVAGPCTDNWGRRWGMFLGALTIVVGTCIQAPAKTMGQFEGGRFILGFGVALTATSGPSYAAEMAHPAYRGVMTAVYNTWWFMGSIPASWITYGTDLHYTDNNSWRIPLWLQMSFSGFVLIFAFFIPESPRWLIANDRHEEALNVMAKYHGDDNRDSPLVQLSYREMCEQIINTGSDKRWWDYRELVNTRAQRWRTTMVVAMSFFGQWSGNAAISYFMPVLLEQAGITDSHTQLMLNGVIAVISFVGATIGATLVDRVGRRPLLFSCACLMTLWWIVVTALSAQYVGTDNKSASNATIAFIYIFGFTFSICFTPLQALYPVECLNFETRAKGMAVYNFFVNIASFFNMYATPVGLGDVKWKFYFVYIAWDAFEAVFIYFLFVETKNKTLEELNSIFDARYPKAESLKKHKVAIAGSHGVAGVLDDSTSNDEHEQVHVAEKL